MNPDQEIQTVAFLEMRVADLEAQLEVARATNEKLHRRVQGEESDLTKQLQQARETNRRLNRRLQEAESDRADLYRQVSTIEDERREQTNSVLRMHLDYSEMQRKEDDRLQLTRQRIADMIPLIHRSYQAHWERLPENPNAEIDDIKSRIDYALTLLGMADEAIEEES